MGDPERLGSRGGATREPARILVVDPVLGSRFLLAQAASLPGCVVETAAHVGEARARISQTRFDLVLSEHRLDPDDGLEFLVSLREYDPGICRALVTERGGMDFVRGAVARADLAFVLTKPWNAQSLRSTIREVIGIPGEWAGWSRVPVGYGRRSAPQAAAGPEPTRDHEVLLRGLLAGLNSCEFPSEVFELVHSELAESFQVKGWLWVDEEQGLATRVTGDWPVESDIALDRLSDEEVVRLAEARRSLRVTRLGDLPASMQRADDRSVGLSLAIRQGNRRTMTVLVFCDRARAAALLSMLRELQGGLQMAFGRIREARGRAEDARRLAERVSEELRTPVGALTHAIDRLRGEVERAGMPTEWVDRVSSESERVARAVEHFEGEMFSRQGGSISRSS